MFRDYFLTPFQKFSQIESLSGMLLFGATVVALAWANSSFGDTYLALWQYKLGIETGESGFSMPLILWINDGLMAIFFFLIGLEIKRELLIGELNSVRKATFPIFAAIGGMVVPLSIFLLLNDGVDTTDGWGIPMATDIAFTLAILQLLGKSVPLSLKVFLTAFAIVDDLGAVLVIAVFYSTGINWILLLISMAILAFLFVLSSRGMYSRYLTFSLGVVVWALFLKSGIHPTIAGVLLAFTVPIQQKVNMSFFINKLSYLADKIKRSEVNDEMLLSTDQVEGVAYLEDLIDDFNSPLQRLEHKMHGWVAYFIMPIFALSNAGIVFSSGMAIDVPLVTNIAIALFLGKFIGVSFFSFLAVRLGLAELPEGIGRLQIMGVAIIAGVGFTMSIFIANLAFVGSPLLMDSAKIGILIGSIVSGFVGAIIIKYSGRRPVELLPAVKQ